jgi:triphosphoribosyl-dephospho-CoA synthase
MNERVRRILCPASQNGNQGLMNSMEAAKEWREHLETCVRAACLLEATTRKPGNVHPRASFADLCYADFVRSGEVVAPILADVPKLGVGQAILDSVVATQAAVGTNTNLGIVLLIAPLAAVPAHQPLADDIGKVLAALDQRDAALVYRAIRAANPGGMGTVGAQDVADEPTGTLLEVMRLAADRDAIASQYTNGFEDILTFGVGVLESDAQFADRWENAVIGLQLAFLARRPDTLIARKRGADVARQSSDWAKRVLDAGGTETEEGTRLLAEFDAWSRADGNARNPGSTADLITATLFAALRDCRVPFPPGWQTCLHALK